MYVRHQMKSEVKISVKWQGTDPDPSTRVVQEDRLDYETRNTDPVMTPKMLNINTPRILLHPDIRNGGRWLIYRYHSCLYPPTTLAAARAGSNQLSPFTMDKKTPPPSPLGQASGKAKLINYMTSSATAPPISGMLNLLTPFSRRSYLYDRYVTWA